MKDLILAIRMRFIHFEYFRGVNKLNRKYKRLRGEIYKKVIQLRGENPFVPVDDSKAREMYENRSFIKLEVGQVYEVQNPEMVFKNKSICEIFPINYQLGTMFRYLGKDGEHYQFQTLIDDEFLYEEEEQILGIPSPEKLKDFQDRMNILQGLRERKDKAWAEYDKLRKYEQDVINR